AADMIVVGKYAGDNSLAAVGATTSLINLLSNLFVGLSIGANVRIARLFGAKDEKNLERTIHTAMLMSLISGIILTVLGVFCTEQILIWMGTPGEVLRLATVYLRIYFLGITGTTVYNFGSAILRAVGDTKRPFYFLLTAGIINVALNLLLVIGFDLDVAGVAIATAVSQIISAILVVKCLMNETSSFRLELKKLRIHKDCFIAITKVGLPAGIQGVIFSLSNVVIQSAVNTFGEVTIAGNSAASNLESFVYFSMNAFYQATISFTSQNYGAHQFKRIKKIFFSSQACVIVVGVILGNLFYLFSHTLLAVYTDSPLVIEAGVKRMLVISTTYALCGIMEVLVGSLRGIGHSLLPMIVSLVGVCGIRLLWLATVFKMDKYHSVYTIYLSYPISWCIAIIALCVLFAITYHFEKKRHGNMLPVT
ncbi:MAG TPA: MATE family efflux transporter, partial [Bacillota bacterium]|nr:MATE family efflux transporter [Bacillota bacterium]